VLAGDHGREGDVVGGEQRVVAAVWFLFDGLTLCRRRRGHAEGKPLPVWAMMATSVDAISFLKASWGFSPSFYMHASGENPRSPDRAVAALRCHALLEDTILEPPAHGSPMVVWWR
jgi:hypothetical protein